MPYVVRELYYTLQGEGANTGRAAVFLRFAGCNLWSGHDADRGRGAACSVWCDTDFVGTDGPGGGRFETARDLAVAVASKWPTAVCGRPFVVCTGGEPLLQLDAALMSELRAGGFEIAVETNGTRPVPEGIDWLTVSPKAGSELLLTAGDELKLIYPQPGAEPQRFEGLNFRHFFLQPLDDPNVERNTRLALEYCLAFPQWRLSLQTHKFLKIP
ncbi:MAG: 7-carboxy-7-deazaguanine synthase [Gemmataceae bacterium]